MAACSGVRGSGNCGLLNSGKSSVPPSAWVAVICWVCSKSILSMSASPLLRFTESESIRARLMGKRRRLDAVAGGRDLEVVPPVPKRMDELRGSCPW